jgi:hypothetical protein
MTTCVEYATFGEMCESQSMHGEKGNLSRDFRKFCLQLFFRGNFWPSTKFCGNVGHV